MASNKIVPVRQRSAMPQQQSWGGGPPAPATQQDGWMWNGQCWVCCDGDFDGGPPPPPCPPFGPPVFSGPAGQPPWYPGANGGVSFGSTPPPNPVRGHMWWDGTAFWLFDGAAWVAIGGAGAIPPGTATGTTPPANPQPGALWFNGATLFVWDGKAWVPTSTTKTTISATAPPSPNPGDEWWDGTTFRIWDGSAWETVGPGAQPGPVPTTTQALVISIPGTLTASTAAWGILPITAAPQIDAFNGWDPVTHKYTPQKAGYYAFQCSQYYGSTMTSAGHALIKNDTGSLPDLTSAFVVCVNALSGPVATIGDYLQSNGSVFLNGTTDFVRLWAFASGGVYFPLSTGVPILRATLLP